MLDVINDIKNSKEFQHSRKSMKIIFNDTTREEYLVDADKGRIYQVIFNLVSNAVKFTEEGVITVSINTEKQSKKSKNDDEEQQQVIVLVKDTGIGIHPEMFTRLFMKFASKSFEGTSLGLFVSKKIIEAHGGKIWAKNNNDNKEKGATFGFSLPLN